MLHVESEVTFAPPVICVEPLSIQVQCFLTTCVKKLLDRGTFGRCSKIMISAGVGFHVAPVSWNLHLAPGKPVSVYVIRL